MVILKSHLILDLHTWWPSDRGYFMMKNILSSLDPPGSVLPCPSTPIFCSSMTWEGTPWNLQPTCTKHETRARRTVHLKRVQRVYLIHVVSVQITKFHNFPENPCSQLHTLWLVDTISSVKKKRTVPTFLELSLSTMTPSLSKLSWIWVQSTLVLNLNSWQTSVVLISSHCTTYGNQGRSSVQDRP